MSPAKHKLRPLHQPLACAMTKSAARIAASSRRQPFSSTERVSAARQTWKRSAKRSSRRAERCEAAYASGSAVPLAAREKQAPNGTYEFCSARLLRDPLRLNRSSLGQLDREQFTFDSDFQPTRIYRRGTAAH